MFNKSNLFQKREESTTPPNGLSPASSLNPAQPTTSPRPTPRPGTFGANMRSPFDTPNQPASSTSSSTTNASNANSAREENANKTAAAKESGSCLIVGPDVKLRGAEILDCDTLVVEGRVEATMDSRVIRIAEHGAFSGKVGIDVAEIHGNFEGDLTAREQLIIHATGRVSGTIRYGKILIEEGGEVSGDVQSLASANSSKIHRDAQGDKVKPLVATSN